MHTHMHTRKHNAQTVASPGSPNTHTHFTPTRYVSPGILFEDKDVAARVHDYVALSRAQARVHDYVAQSRRGFGVRTIFGKSEYTEDGGQLKPVAVALPSLTREQREVVLAVIAQAAEAATAGAAEGGGAGAPGALLPV
jgi:hypothetical protein